MLHWTGGYGAAWAGDEEEFWRWGGVTPSLLGGEAIRVVLGARAQGPIFGGLDTLRLVVRIPREPGNYSAKAR